jgi:transcriptional regulator with XRE-family HTH domain
MITTSTLSNALVNGDIDAIKKASPLEFGQEFKRLRHALGYALKRAARGSGVTPGTVKSWEAGERKPRAGHLLLLGMHRLLGRKVDSFEKASPRRFGAELRRLRLAKGMTLDDVAAVMEVSAPTIRDWEAGKRKPWCPPSKLFWLACQPCKKSEA